MLFNGARWQDTILVLEFFDIDGSRQAITCNAAEASDLLFELKQQEPRIVAELRAMNRRAEQESKEQIL